LFEPGRKKGVSMELFSTEFFAALGAIILIDLVLAGDNAIVIALAARSLPKDLQKRAIFWGAVGAIGVRALMTMAVVWLLQIPGLMLAGGVLLLWIAVKLIAPGSAEAGSQHPGVTGFWAAMKTIVVADAVMGLDNVLAVAGAAHGSLLLVVLGLLISIPIVVAGSTVILHWVERFPAIIYAGAAMLAWTSAKMVMGDPVLKPWVEPYAGYAWLIYVVTVAGVLLAGWLRQSSQRAKIERIALAPRAVSPPMRARPSSGRALPFPPVLQRLLQQPSSIEGNDAESAARGFAIGPRPH